MKTDILFATATLIASLAPVALAAAPVDDPVTVLSTVAEFRTQSRPTQTSVDTEIGASDTFFDVEALLTGIGAPIPSPLVPNSVGSGFASAAGDSAGNFAVGVNSFFFPSSRPQPHEMLASGALTQDLFNDTGEIATFGATFFIPEPRIVLVGQVGDFFPVGGDPALDVTANVLARVVTTLTRVDGSTFEEVVFEYGMRTSRDPATGALGVTTTLGAGGPAVFEEPGFFSFLLPERAFELDSIAVLAPGESVTLDFQYFATGGTGFGETGVFAAIGDPFDIASGGGRFTFTQGDAINPPPPPPPPPPSSVPLPAGLPLLAAALLALACARRLRS